MGMFMSIRDWAFNSTINVQYRQLYCARYVHRSLELFLYNYVLTMDPTTETSM